MKSNSIKERIKNRIKKILENPEIGKPMRYARKGTRELYIGSFRLSYAYLRELSSSRPTPIKGEDFIQIKDGKYS